MEYCLAIKENDILLFAATWIELQGIMKRKTNIVCGILYLESTTKVANKTKMRQTHRYREQTSAYQWGEEREVGKHSRSFF